MTDVCRCRVLCVLHSDDLKGFINRANIIASDLEPTFARIGSIRCMIDVSGVIFKTTHRIRRNTKPMCAFGKSPHPCVLHIGYLQIGFFCSCNMGDMQ